jgi:TatD DNase family protein
MPACSARWARIPTTSPRNRRAAGGDHRPSAHRKCVGIGETGLDYHYDRSPRDVQRRVFRQHIAAARQTGLPLVIHARLADDDMIAILGEEMRAGPFQAVLHCFSSGAALAKAGVELGLYVSFSGILTFVEDLRAIAQTPMDRLRETDAPYLPGPGSRWRNESALYRVDGTGCWPA